MNRVTFIVDGFNLYHSVRNAQNDLKGATTKWLDIRSLCRSYIHHFGRDAVLEDVYYCSAIADHLEARKPEVTSRHRTFIECLEDSGVRINLNRFKRKEVWCPKCQCMIEKYEEKETDVIISLLATSVLHGDLCDTVVLLTGDTDQSPTARYIQRRFPSKKIIFAFPYRRQNQELKDLCPGSFTIGRNQYLNHQFPDPFVTKAGKSIAKPASW